MLSICEFDVPNFLDNNTYSYEAFRKLLADKPELARQAGFGVSVTSDYRSTERLAAVRLVVGEWLKHVCENVPGEIFTFIGTVGSAKSWYFGSKILESYAVSKLLLAWRTTKLPNIRVFDMPFTTTSPGFAQHRISIIV